VGWWRQGWWQLQGPGLVDLGQCGGRWGQHLEMEGPCGPHWGPPCGGPPSPPPFVGGPMGAACVATLLRGPCVWRLCPVDSNVGLDVDVWRRYAGGGDRGGGGRVGGWRVFVLFVCQNMEVLGPIVRLMLWQCVETHGDTRGDIWRCGLPRGP